jgi:hypothetical protein
VPVKAIGFQVHWYGAVHRQTVLLAFEPILLVMLIQLTQVLLMVAVVLVLQVQVPLIKIKGEGQ